MGQREQAEPKSLIVGKVPRQSISGVEERKICAFGCGTCIELSTREHGLRLRTRAADLADPR
jgi:hypothetical protein